MRDNAELVAYIARVSSEKPKSIRGHEFERLLKYLLRHRHWSPFEHCYYTFEVNTSLDIATQMLRHRSFTFQQLSKRYNSDLHFMPVELRLAHPISRQSSISAIDKDHYLYHKINDLLIQIRDLYLEMLYENEIASECARSILPQCTHTELIMTGNLRSWYHFVQVRKDEHAQLEMQAIANMIYEVMKEDISILFNDLRTVSEELYAKTT